MNFNGIEFIASYATAAQLPQSAACEICFAGRSNVGKSSLINRICGKKAMARTGSKPGKTVTVNFYGKEDLRLVDLPGYGYAKISFDEKMRFAGLMEGYFSGRDIKHCFVLLDMRHAPTAQDMQMLELLKNSNIPYTAVLTKCDKLGVNDAKRRLREMQIELAEYAENAELIPFSALNGTGVEQLREIIEKNS